MLDFAHYNYANYNPRLGETLLLLVDGSRLVHCIITPAFQLALLVFAFVLAHAAWPRATLRDLGRLVLLQAVLWLVIPIPGVLYFYRPYAANYLFATCLQLGLFAMFRLELARPYTTRRAWLAPIMLALGVAAGMGNEHTGPTAIVAAIAVLVWAHRQRRLRAWMLCGVIGLVLGYALLVLAPGQSVRYAAMAAGEHPFRAMLIRGIDGNFKFVGDFLVEVAPGLAFVIAGALIAFARRHTARAGDRVELSRSLAIRIALAFAAALAIVITTFASPIVEDRLFFAPCVVTAIALAMVSDALTEPRVRALMIAAATLVVVVHVLGFAVTYREVVVRTDARIAALQAATSRDVVTVAPTEEWRRDHWQYGEDLQFAYLRELLAHRVFDVDALELASAPGWAQPTPPEQVDVRVQLDRSQVGPSSGVVAPLGMRPPTQWPWVVRESPRSMARARVRRHGSHDRRRDHAVRPNARRSPGPPRDLASRRLRVSRRAHAVRCSGLAVCVVRRASHAADADRGVDRRVRQRRADRADDRRPRAARRDALPLRRQPHDLPVRRPRMLARLAVLVSDRRSPAPGTMVLAALWLHQLVMAYLAPLAGDDWRALVDPPAPTTHDLVLGVLVHAPFVHAIVTPVVAILLVVGTCTLALGRRVDLNRDALAIALASTLIWLAAPRAGVDFSNRSFAAGEPTGPAVRCGSRSRRGMCGDDRRGTS